MPAYDNVDVYDGSGEDWGNRQNLSMEQSQPPSSIVEGERVSPRVACPAELYL
jgi:hypothetical protein